MNFWRPKRIAIFSDWLNTADPKSAEPFASLQAATQQKQQEIGRPPNQDELKEIALTFNKDVQSSIMNEKLLCTAYDADVCIDLNGGSRDDTAFEYLRVGTNNSGISLQNLKIRNLQLTYASNKTVCQNCWIDRLEIMDCGEIYLKNCLVGSLIFHRGITNLEVQGGCVLTIKCAPAHGENPFKGSVLFQRVYFPRNPGFRLADAQPYRNMRAHMQKNENTPMAALFHTLEQAVERKQDTSLFARFVSWSYEIFSDYGSSLTRPAIWFFCLIFLSCVILFLTDGVAAGDNLHAWQAGLGHTGHWRQLQRAILLSLQGTLNPLGIFGTSGMVAPRYGWLAAWMFFHSLLSTIFAALFVLALRRRFKMS